jgi:diacylglycerol O-acyltransferase
MTREPLRPVDAAWLRMDSPDNGMVITAMLSFDALPEPDRLLRLVEERLLPHRRFRQRVVDSRFAGPAWELDPHFDIAAHFHRLALPSPGGQAELETLVGELMSIPLDHTRPLWHIYAIEGVGSAAALVARLHHSMGDGVALVRLLLGLTDEGPLAPPPEVGVDAPHPTRVVDRAKLLARQTTTLGRLLVLPGDHETVLRGELGTRKLAAWSPAIELDIPKAIASATGTKLNDVLVAALTGALRRELEGRGSFDRKHDIRALVPVYVRTHADLAELGNHFGLVYVPLPLTVLDPIERLEEVKRRFDEVKAEPDAVVSLGVLAAMGVAVSELERVGIELFTKKASVMITNVPGPPFPIHFGDREVTDMLVWAPVSGQIGVGLSLLSYANHLRLGVAADALRIPQPASLARAFTDEVEMLFRAARRTREAPVATSSAR